MKIALLGADSESVALARAAVSLGHELSWCGDLAAFNSVADDLGLTDQHDLWEELLDGDVANALIVGRGAASSDLRGEQIKQLVKSGVPILTSFPLADSVLTYYEIDMARGESGALLQHYNPLTSQKTVCDQCTDWIDQGHPELGPIEQIVWERPLGERTQANVLWHFTRDVELLSGVAGGLNRLGALGSPNEAATYAGLSVQLLGKRDVPVRWQVGPIEDDDHSTLVLVAENGKVIIEFDGNSQAIAVSVSRAGEIQTAPVEPVDGTSQSVESFVAAVGANGKQSHSTWAPALAAMELTDTIEIALRRGRMIEVHQQQLTEQMAFKGTMSAVGCGVLLTIPPLLLLCGWIAELLGLSIARYWPHALLALLALFLGIQLIPKLVFKVED